jgi:superfamily II DNA or RNA helicase
VDEGMGINEFPCRPRRGERVKLWAHQERGRDGVIAAANDGCQRICCTSPTGGGKTNILFELINHFRCPTVIYTNRKMLREQVARNMEAAGIRHGVRAAGVEPALLRDVQVSSIQTEESRVFKRKKWQLHRAKLVLVDECHNQVGRVAQKVIDKHIDDGATVVGFTATPLDLEAVYDHLVIAGCTSELRDCGALLWCRTFAPDEPDERHIKPVKVGEDFTEKENVKAIMRPGIEGRVINHWRAYNPEQRPTILFGPDVAGSLWFAEKFQEDGIDAAHIDGEKIWIKGEFYPTDQEHRDYLAKLSQTGEVKVVCNRFVMREGIDWPWLYHAIMATAFGSVTSYLQSGGRLLRNHTSLDHVVLQDHGGNFHRHGSLNEDREWELGLTSHIVAVLRQERLRQKAVKEPIVCPNCKAVRMGGPRCTMCGTETTRKSRMVVQSDGVLVEVEGDRYRERKTKEKPDTEQLWRDMYYRAKNSRQGMTFSQAYGLFFTEYRYWPPRDLPLMPKTEMDWFRKVKQVDTNSLTGERCEVDNR